MVLVAGLSKFEFMLAKLMRSGSVKLTTLKVKVADYTSSVSDSKLRIVIVMVTNVEYPTLNFEH